MTGRKLRRPLYVCLTLAFIGGIVFCLAVVSGVMHFVTEKPDTAPQPVSEDETAPFPPSDGLEKNEIVIDETISEGMGGDAGDGAGNTGAGIGNDSGAGTDHGTADGPGTGTGNDAGSDTGTGTGDGTSTGTGSGTGTGDDTGSGTGSGTGTGDGTDTGTGSGSGTGDGTGTGTGSGTGTGDSTDTGIESGTGTGDGTGTDTGSGTGTGDSTGTGTGSGTGTGDRIEIGVAFSSTTPLDQASETEIPLIIAPAPAETTVAEPSSEAEQTLPSGTDAVEAETTTASETPEASDAEPIETPKRSIPWGLLFWLSISLLVADLAGIAMVSLRIDDLSKQRVRRPMAVPAKPADGQLTVGTVHRMGKRKYQQDSLGHSIVLDGRGLLAVVADGMGGLQDGDKVSQQIVLRTLELGGALHAGQEIGALPRILKQVNDDVNRSLTNDGLYKSGSTMVAVLVSGKEFQWISVGDSRIYLYRAGYVNQLSRDHDLLQDWMPEILDGRRSLEEAMKDPSARKLTSFIGMGQLKHVDGSVSPVDILPGDRILLMTDGVYGSLSDSQLAGILQKYPDVRQAAAEIDRRIRGAQNPHQDNYTAMILGF